MGLLAQPITHQGRYWLIRVVRPTYPPSKCLRSLATYYGSLFVHGHSLDPNDRHVLRGVVEGKFKALFISLHGDPESETNREIPCSC